VEITQEHLVTARFRMVRDHRGRGPEDRRVKGKVGKVATKDQSLKHRDKDKGRDKDKDRAGASKAAREATKDQSLKHRDKDSRVANKEDRGRSQVAVVGVETTVLVVTRPKPTTCGHRKCLLVVFRLLHQLHRLNPRDVLLPGTIINNNGQLVVNSKRANRVEAGVNRRSSRSNSRGRRAARNSNNPRTRTRSLRRRIEVVLLQSASNHQAYCTPRPTNKKKVTPQKQKIHKHKKNRRRQHS